MNRRILTCSLITIMAAGVVSAFAVDAQKIGNVDVSAWRGFNLPGKYYGVEPQAVEDDFRMIAELGFNFVRLCLDYRRYVAKDDWLAFNEDALKEIDRAVDCGKKYNIHVCLDLHSAPGHVIGEVKEHGSLWDDRKAQDAFCEHWAMFARRYRHIPQERLSFNLVNEPAHGKYENCVVVFRRAIETIHAIDPRRLIVVDGFGYGQRGPYTELVPLPNVIPATRGYQPFSLTHYRASGAKGSDTWPLPTWPMLPGILYSRTKKREDLNGPLVFKVDLRENTEIAIKVHEVSVKSVLVAKADGKTVWEKTFAPKEGKGEWKEVVFDEKSKSYRNIYDREYRFRLPTAAGEISIENIDGNFLSFSELTLRLPDGRRWRFSTDTAWGHKPGVCKISADGKILPLPDCYPEKMLNDDLQPWLDIAAQGVPVFVGEFGAFNKTPHDVTLAWMKDCLERWKKARIGWALWTFRGPFGILDSKRADVEYEDFHGHKLDRKMLDLLRQHLKD